MKLHLAAIAVCIALLTPLHSAIADTAQPAVQLDTSSMGPREIEDLTEKKIVRDYAAAWRTLAAAMEQDRPALLGDYFTGFAKTQFAQAVSEQNATGIHRRYDDRGHKVQGLFYSQDGGVMQLRDRAEYEVEVFDGEQLLYRETKRATFIVIMTPAADRWMVRLLQEESTQ